MGEKGTLGYEAMKRGLLPVTGAHVVPHTFGPSLTGHQLPEAGQLAGQQWQVDPNDSDHAFKPDTGENANWDGEKEQWINSQTGEPLGASGTTVVN